MKTNEKPTHDEEVVEEVISQPAAQVDEDNDKTHAATSNVSSLSPRQYTAPRQGPPIDLTQKQICRDEGAVQEVPVIEANRFSLATGVLLGIFILLMFGMGMHIFYPSPESAQVFDYVTKGLSPILLLVIGAYFGRQSR